MIAWVSLAGSPYRLAGPCSENPDGSFRTQRKLSTQNRNGVHALFAQAAFFCPESTEVYGLRNISGNLAMLAAILRASSCDLTKLSDQIEAAGQKNDPKKVETLAKQVDALVAKLGPEYSKLTEGLEEVDPDSSEAKEFMSILSGLDKLCSK